MEMGKKPKARDNSMPSDLISKGCDRMSHSHFGADGWMGIA
jgi:hypothetical protein